MQRSRFRQFAAHGWGGCAATHGGSLGVGAIHYRCRARRVHTFDRSQRSRPIVGRGARANYSLQIFVAGASTAVQTVSLGKPTPQSDGMIRVDFVSLLSTPLTPAVVYESVVSAVGPGGSAPSARSNTFAFSAPCAPSISPTSQADCGRGRDRQQHGDRRNRVRLERRQQRAVDHDQLWRCGHGIRRGVVHRQRQHCNHAAAPER